MAIFSEIRPCPICGTENEFRGDKDVVGTFEEDYFCDTCGYFRCYCSGEGGHGIDFGRAKIDWMSACKEIWKGGKYGQSD